MKFWQIKASIKDSIPDFSMAFHIGEKCYYCDYFANPCECDMCRDETCEKSENIIVRLFFAIKIFKRSFEQHLDWYKRYFNDR